jgi:hypothetical protein
LRWISHFPIALISVAAGRLDVPSERPKKQRLRFARRRCYTAPVISAPIRRARWPLVIGLMLVFAFLLTNSEPWVPMRRAATAQQVEAAQDAFRQVRRNRTTGQPSDILLNANDLDSIAVMVGQGFPPNRLAFRLDDRKLKVTASRPFLSRWLNVRAEAAGQSVGFPALKVTVGFIHFPAWLSRAGLALGRQLLAFKGARLPPLDTIVQSTSIASGSLRARLLIPATGLIDQAVASEAIVFSDATVSDIYCRLAAQQRSAPDLLFAHQLQRALVAARPTGEQHAAALVALAMLVVDPGVGKLVGNTLAKAKSCIIPPLPTSLQGRMDWPKHWSLSAALTVTTGNRFTIAMGEWKELSDSLSKNAYLAHDDPSGFSFVDLAADRAGFHVARQLIDPTRLGRSRTWLLSATDEQLLPGVTTRLNDGMSNAEFVRRFGATDDPRFVAELDRIDSELDKAGVN